MKKLILLILLLIPTLAYSAGVGVINIDTDCNQAKYYVDGMLCQDSDDKKVYKGTGAAIEEIGTGAEVDPIVTTETTGFTITRGTTPATLTVTGDATISGTPLTSEADTLATVTGRGATTTEPIDTTGLLSGGICTITKAVGDTGYVIGTTNAREKYRCVIFVSGVTTINLPAIGAGMGFCIYSTDATVKTIDPNSSDRIVLDWVALSDGVAIVSSGTIGDFACFIWDVNGWIVLNHIGFSSE